MTTTSRASRATRQSAKEDGTPVSNTSATDTPSTDTTVIQIRDVSKRFVIHKEKSLKERIVNFGRSQKYKDDFWALQGISLDIHAGTTVGLVGPNGSGKSTLLKVIGGILSPTTGTVLGRGRLAALLELGAGFHEDLTGRENVYLNAAVLGLSRKETDATFDDIVEFSGIGQFIDTQVKFYSSGMYVRLAFAVAVHVDPEVLLVDEVLAVGDEPFQRKCMDKIRSFQEQGKTIILVTHSAEQIGELCDRAIVLRKGHVEFDGDAVGALRVLRTGFDEAAHEDQSDEDLAENDGITLVRVDVMDPKTSTEAKVIKPGAALRVDVTVRAAEPLENWVVSIGIDTPLGQGIFATNTRVLGTGKPKPIVGTQTVSFDLAEVHLGHGEYVVHAAVGTADEESLVRISDAARFESEDTTRNRGVVAIDTTFSVA